MCSLWISDRNRRGGAASPRCRGLSAGPDFLRRNRGGRHRQLNPWQLNPWAFTRCPKQYFAKSSPDWRKLRVRPELKHVTSIGYRHPRESGGPEQPFKPCGPWVPAFAQDCPGKVLRRRREGNRPPISSWPGLTRPSTALSGLDKDVDARIKSAQDEVKLFWIGTTQVGHAGKFLSDSPARKREPRDPVTCRRRCGPPLSRWRQRGD